MSKMTKVLYFVGLQNLPQLALSLDVPADKPGRALSLIASSVAKNLHENPEFGPYLRGSKKSDLAIKLHIGEGKEEKIVEFKPSTMGLRTFGAIMAAAQPQFVEAYDDFFKIDQKTMMVEGYSCRERVLRNWVAERVKLMTNLTKGADEANGTAAIRAINKGFAVERKQLAEAAKANALQLAAAAPAGAAIEA